MLIFVPCACSKHAENWSKSLKVISVKNIFVNLCNLSNGHVESPLGRPIIENRFAVSDTTEGRLTSFKLKIGRYAQLQESSLTCMPRLGFFWTVLMKVTKALSNLAQLGCSNATERKIRGRTTGSQD